MTTIPFFFSKTITGSIQTYSVSYPDHLTSALMESLKPDLSESNPAPFVDVCFSLPTFFTKGFLIVVHERRRPTAFNNSI